MSALFDAYGRYYQLLYQDKDDAAEVAYVCSLLQALGTGRDLLEFGSGTGRHGRLLAQRGYRVLGVERSAQMLAQALPCPGFDSVQGDILEIDLGRRFSAVLALFHVVSYQTSNAAVSAVFARAAAHLDAGGFFVFDVWYSPAVHAQRAEVRAKRMADANTAITRIAEPRHHPAENRVDVHYTVFAQDLGTGAVQQLTETHPMRHFSGPELDFVAAQAGFDRVLAQEFGTGRAPGEDTWGVCFAYRKR